MEKNYGIMNIGSFQQDLAAKGRVMAGQELNLTGCEISFNYMPAGEIKPFVHTHKLNEEVYIIISGEGMFMVDGEEFAVREGSVIRISPAGERVCKAGAQDMVYICIQAERGSLTQATQNDGVRIESGVSWLKQ